MRCFRFYYNGDNKKEEEPKTPTPTVGPSSSHLSFSDRDIRPFESGFNSQNASDTSVESRARSHYPPEDLSEKTSNLRVFAFAELRQVTKNFSHTSKLGEGGFGCVYKGIIRSSEDPSKRINVAVKQLGKRGLQGHKEWVTEVNVLGIVEHPNLVKLIGHCAEDDERGIQRLLVYEYMQYGSVEDHLSVRSPTPLSWTMRLKVALEAARGLTYLHEEMDFQIIFRDFKSSNILLDEHWNAKLSDFGLARLGPSDGLTHVSTAVVGTLGYAAPEYLHTGRLTSKSDVWSYGVFLYELITGRPALDRNRPRGEQKLLDWVKQYVTNPKKFEQILDPRLDSKTILKSARKLSLVANSCLSGHPKARPKMSEVREMVNRVYEAYLLLGGDEPQPSLKSRDEFDENGKRRLEVGSNWLGRIWVSKLVRSC